VPAYVNRAQLKSVGYSAVEELLKLVQNNPELPIIQQYVKRWVTKNYPTPSTVPINLLADAFNARDSFRMTLSVGDFNPRSSWLM
jgi:hypothetical protein